MVHTMDPGRLGWVQVARGTLSLNGVELKAGDGAAIKDELLFDMADNEG